MIFPITRLNLNFFEQYKIDCRATIEMIENETDENASNFEQSQNSSKYVDRFSNPNASSKNKSRNNSNNDVGQDIEIKTEKPDDDMVSFTMKTCKKMIHYEMKIRLHYSTIIPVKFL